MADQQQFRWERDRSGIFKREMAGAGTLSAWRSWNRQELGTCIVVVRINVSLRVEFSDMTPLARRMLSCSLSRSRIEVSSDISLHPERCQAF
mmetsp:Transcript_10856/g.30026  ORF Transcript_10856/g.30026 Transcript_10856/m.30026 type:complete len:92 (-) Transcript_10856:734-1009(-)